MCTFKQVCRHVHMCVCTYAYVQMYRCVHTQCNMCVHAHDCHLRRDRWITLAHTIVYPMEVKVLHSVRFELVHSPSGSHVSAQQHHRH